MSSPSIYSRVGVILQHLWIQALLTGNGRKMWSCQKCSIKRHNPRTEIRTEVTAVGAGRGRALASCPRNKEPKKCRGNHMEGASLGALCTRWLVARSRGTDSLIAMRIFALSLSFIAVHVVFGSVLSVYDGLPLPQWCFAELVIFGKISANKRPSLPVLFVSIFFRTPVGRPQKGSTPPRLAPDTTWLECAGRAATRRSGLRSLQGVITNGTWRLCRSGV